jgi:hypothetical protein
MAQGLPCGLNQLMVHIWRCVVEVVTVMVVFVPETCVVIKEAMVYVPIVSDFSQFSNSFSVGFCEGITTTTIKTKVKSTMARTTSVILTFRFMKGQRWIEFHIFNLPESARQQAVTRSGARSEITRPEQNSATAAKP